MVCQICVFLIFELGPDTTECNLLVLGWKRPADGYRIALIGATSLHVGGSALDATTDCGSAMPDQADPAILTIILKKVRVGVFEEITDILYGGCSKYSRLLPP